MHMGTQQVVGRFKGEAIWGDSSVAICRLISPRRIQGGNWLELAILEFGKISISKNCRENQW